MVRAPLTALVAVLTLGFATACESPPPPPPPAPDTSEFEESPPPPPAPVVKRVIELQTVYFDFDRSDIRGDQTSALRSNADQIGGLSGAVTIQGHTDERGSEEYNLALGERRARSVKRYLVDLGVPSSKLRTVSYGEARPAVPGHNESAWQYNRRAEFATSQ